MKLFQSTWGNEDSNEKGFLEAQQGNGDYRLVDDIPESAQRLIERGGTDIARIIAPSSARFYPDYFTLGNHYCRVIYMQVWPSDVAPGWLNEIYAWPRSISISIYYQPLSHEELLKTLQRKSAREASDIDLSEKKGNIVDQGRVRNLEDAMQFQNDLQRGYTKPFQLSFIITVRGENLAELNDLTIKIEKSLNSIQAEMRRAEMRQKDAFLSCMPYGRNYIADDFSTRNMQTAAARTTFPFTNADLTHPSGIWYGINRSTNSNVILDRFALQSPHAVVLGESGSGKSYSAKLEMLRSLMRGYPVTVIDPDAECRIMCEEVGGQFITISPNSKDRINVLDFSYMSDGVDDQLTTKILSVIKLIGTMMNPDGSGYGLNAEQVQLLQRIMADMYADFGYSTDPRTQVPETMGGPASPDRMPVLSDLRARIERISQDNQSDPRLFALLRDIISALGPYTSGGIFAGLFDQRTTVNLHGQFLVFNIKPIADSRNPHLMTLGMQTVLDFIWNTHMNRQQQLSGQRRMIYVDEAHVMMRSPESAQFLEELMRRARKCNVGVTVLTQDPVDFLRPDRPQGRVIFGNSSMQILLKMKRNSLEVLQELMGLDDVEVDLLLTRGRGEGMLFAHTDRVWVSMHTASQRENDMITTDPEEMVAIRVRRAAEQLETPVAPPRMIAQKKIVQMPQQPVAQLPPPRRSQLGTPEPVSQLGPPIVTHNPWAGTSGPKPIAETVPPSEQDEERSLRRGGRQLEPNQLPDKRPSAPNQGGLLPPPDFD